jgi:hypothetical protein
MQKETFSEVFEFMKYSFERLDSSSLNSHEIEGLYGPIIGIHGVWGEWVRGGLIDFMKKEGVSGSLMYLGSLTKSIDSYLPQIDEQVAKYKLPYLVGISAGGLLAIRYGQVYGWEKVNKIITIGTPFSGTKIANILKPFGRIFQEIEPGSDFLKNIINVSPPSGKAISIFAKHDEFALNPEAIATNWEKIILSKLGHYAMQNDFEWINPTLRHILGVK